MESPQIRIAVTGSRGKSGVVRLLHRALEACGYRTWSRITGLVPRELGPHGERPILRPSGAHVAEMKWWLQSLPPAQAVVMENSAVSPELQGLCPRWLKPTATVLTNLRPDHQAQWGPDQIHALEALSLGLPRGGAVVLPQDLAQWPPMVLRARERKLTLIPATAEANLPPHRSANLGLALALCRHLALDLDRCQQAMEALEPDAADFAVLSLPGAQLAFAFSVNDLTTTQELLASLGWDQRDTEVIYNHRSDRMDRLRAFQGWLQGDWKAVHVIGHRPPRGPLRGAYRALERVEDLEEFLQGRGKVLGCGNSVYGLPLKFKLALEERSLKEGRPL